MSTELTVYDDSYLAQLMGGEEEITDLAGEVNPLDLMPRLLLPRDGTKDIKCTLGEDTLFTKRRVFALPVWVGSRRSLWRPDGDEGSDKARSARPVCTTGTVNVGAFRRGNDQGVGTRLVTGNEGLPTHDPSLVDYGDDIEVNVPCRECRFNQFGSMAIWDEAKGGEGKACSESRMLALRIVERVQSFHTAAGEEVGLYTYNEDSPIVLMNLPSTSIRTIRKMAAAAVSRKIPLSRLVWSLGVEIKENGSATWAVLDANIAGYPVREILQSIDADRDHVMALFDPEHNPKVVSAQVVETQADDGWAEGF